VNGVWTIVVYGLREALRRKVFAVVLLRRQREQD